MFRKLSDTKYAQGYDETVTVDEEGITVTIEEELGDVDVTVPFDVIIALLETQGYKVSK